MTTRLSFLIVFFLFSTALITAESSANVWIDESFEDIIAFGPSGTDIDGYSFNAITNPLNVTQSGAISNQRAFTGSISYELNAGESVTINEPYQDPANGPFQYLQFAVSIGEIPTTPGTFAELRWNWLLNLTEEHSVFLRFDSDGSQVTITAGEDAITASSGLLATLTDTDSWTYITIQVQKNASDENDSRPEINQAVVPEGIYFYSSSTTPAVTIVPGGTPDSTGQARDWSLSVTDGTLFIDDVYFEGGMTDTLDGTASVPPDSDNIRALDNVGSPTQALPSSSVEDWKRYN